MSSGCNHAIEYVYQYIDHELNWSKRVRVRMHLRRCEGCDDAFGFEEKLKELIANRCCDEPPAELYERIKALIREEAARNEGA